MVYPHSRFWFNWVIIIRIVKIIGGVIEMNKIAKNIMCNTLKRLLAEKH